MMKIKTFVCDAFYTFLYFSFQGLNTLTYILSEILSFIKSFFIGFIIPLLIDLYCDLIYLSRSIYYETAYHLSILCLKISQMFSFLSKYLLSRAENISQKRAW